jgi:hypothetical protein
VLLGVVRMLLAVYGTKTVVLRSGDTCITSYGCDRVCWWVAAVAAADMATRIAVCR